MTNLIDECVNNIHQYNESLSQPECPDCGNDEGEHYCNSCDDEISAEQCREHKGVCNACEYYLKL